MLPVPGLLSSLRGFRDTGSLHSAVPALPLRILPLEGGPAGRSTSLVRAWPAGSAQHSCQQSSEGNLSCGHTYLQKALDIQFLVGGWLPWVEMCILQTKKKKKKRILVNSQPSCHGSSFQLHLLILSSINTFFSPKYGPKRVL